MEMDSIHTDDMEGNADESSEQLNSPYCSYLNGIYGEPDVIPRVGDQYQVEIPALIPERDRLKLIICSANSELKLKSQNSFLLGLPIPVMWTKGERFIGFHEVGSENEKPTTSKNENTEPKPKAEPGGRSTVRVIVLALPCQRSSRRKVNRLGLSLCPFPGTLGESWEDGEGDRFLLGLYILGKNLTAVKRLVESKNMGDILCFYYGKFYRSSDYKRWADGRSLRSRRSVQGHKLFTGWRQQELLSRISSHVSKECQSLLLEASREFREEKMSLEEYVFTLKDKVGADILIEAIGIGKGKKDLTSAAMEPQKTHHVAVSANSEVPSGNACSSLSSADIIKFLTGGFRLSKARSSDLFWEAVWPRLLARGWHSEQPKDHARNSLVFITPGIKKFSRRRLVKGNHYFDSVSDVLSKVATEPGLLELETKETKEENEKDLLVKEDGLNVSECKKRKRYLQPLGMNQNGDVMKFTIVDTSMSHGVEKGRVWELRSLPVENGSLSTTSSFSGESEHYAPEESENEDEELTNTSVYVNGSLDTGKSKSVDILVGTNANQSMVSLTGKQEKKKNLKVKTGNTKYLSVGGKRSRLADENVSKQKKPENKESHLRSNSAVAYDMMGDNKDQTQKLSLICSFAEENASGRKQGGICHVGAFSHENPEPHADFDLNVPQVSQNFENDKPIITDEVQNDESCADQSSVQVETGAQPKAQELPDGEASTDLQTNRRKSTRNRPLTTKALEAFAFGFLGSPKNKRKEAEGSQNNSRPKRSKRMTVTADFRIGTGKDASNPDENG